MNRRNLLSYLLAFASGASALVYQVVWVKIMALSFGSTAIPAAIVIGGMMAGMGAGAAIYHLIENRHPKAFVLYGSIEIAIAVTAGLVTPVLYRLPDFFGATANYIHGHWSLTVFHFVSVLAIIAIPSALMGATFPALSRAVIRSKHGLKESLGPIYGLNTVGAAAGALLAGFILIEAVGNLRSVLLANGANVLIGATALWMSRSETPLANGARGRTDPPSVPVSWRAICHAGF